MSKWLEIGKWDTNFFTIKLGVTFDNVTLLSKFLLDVYFDKFIIGFRLHLLLIPSMLTRFQDDKKSIIVSLQNVISSFLYLKSIYKTWVYELNGISCLINMKFVC